jgi:RNA polymerase sigma-70 factor (ECF subfamily)
VAALLSMAHGAGVEASAPSYDELYRAHRARVIRLCRLLLGDPDEAEDVGQEVFVKLLLATEYPREREMAWGPWLSRVAIHACRDRQRSRWWRRWWSVSLALDEDSVASSWRTPEGEVVSADQQRCIWRAFERLAPRQREVFVLRHVEGWSTREVADALGVETGSVKRHLFRAVRRLRGALAEARQETS